MRIEKGHKEEANVVDKQRGANIRKGGAYITSQILFIFYFYLLILIAKRSTSSPYSTIIIIIIITK